MSRFSDPRTCWRCDRLHFGQCQPLGDGPAREDMEDRMNAFLARYADNCADPAKAERVRMLAVPPRGLYT